MCQNISYFVKEQFTLLVTFSPIFVIGTKIIFSYNFVASLSFAFVFNLKPEKISPTFHPTSRFCHVGWNVGMVCAIKKFIKFRKRRKKSCWMMLDEVCSRTKFHPTCLDAKVWIFYVGLVWWGVSSNVHQFSLISNVCTFELQFEFLNVFSNFEFRFNHKHLLWMRKAQDHVLQLYYKTMYY